MLLFCLSTRSLWNSKPGMNFSRECDGERFGFLKQFCTHTTLHFTIPVFYVWSSKGLPSSCWVNTLLSLNTFLHVCLPKQPCSLKLPLELFVSVLCPLSYKWFIVYSPACVECGQRLKLILKTERIKTNPQKIPKLQTWLTVQVNSRLPWLMCRFAIVCRIITYQGRGCVG